MSRIVLMILMASCVWALPAQEVVDFQTGVPVMEPLSDTQGVSDDTQRVFQNTQGLFYDTHRVSHDSLSLAFPLLTSRGTIARYPSYSSFFAGYSDWALHEGLNASLSASAIFGLGHHGGSGFANSVSLMYAERLTPRLSVAAGGYYSVLDWRGRRYSDAGLSAMLNYRFDEHWEATVFAQKSIMQPRLPRQMYWMEDIGDKIGAEVRYHFSPSFSVGVSVWEGRRNAPGYDGWR